MKLKNKTIIAIITVIVMLFVQQTIYAVGTVYQAIIDRGEKKLIYRTVAKPFSGTLNEFSTYNKWVYNKDTQNVKAEWGSYKTADLIFTQEYIGKYSENGKYKDGKPIEVGYASFDSSSPFYFSVNVKYVENWIRNNAESTHKQNVKVEDGFGASFYEYSYNSAENPTVTNQNLSQDVFKKYNANTIPNVGKTKVYGSLFSSKVVNGTVMPVENTIAVDGIVEYKTLREMLYHLDEDMQGKTINYERDKDDTAKMYYITDVILDAQTTQELVNYKAEKGGNIYVSTIPYTLAKAGDQSSKFYMLTPGAFLHAKARDFKGNRGWSQGTLGAKNDGLSSGLNYWDNELLLPDGEQASRKIVINHIAVSINSQGKNEYTLIETDNSTLSLKNEEDTQYISAEQLYIESDKTVTTSQTPSPVLLGDQEIQNGMLQYTMGVAKDTTMYKVNKLDGYTFIGSSVDKTTNIAGVTYEYFDKKYKAISDVLEFDIEDSDTEIIVNMYYELPKKEIVVEHKLCTDSNLTNCVNVTGNKFIEIYNASKDTWEKQLWEGIGNVEKYYVDVNTTVSIGRKWNFEIYKGYRLSYNGDIDNKQALLNEGVFSSTVNKNMKIVFYYQQEDPEKGENYLGDLERDIPGTLYVRSAVDLSAECQDTADGKVYYSVATNAKNNENDLYVGIRNTPRYILAGMDLKSTSKKSSVKINVNMSLGDKKKTVTIDVPFTYYYYVLEDLLIYKYNKARIYDAGQTNTKGESVFGTNTLDILPKYEPTSPKLTFGSKYKKEIDEKDMADLNNYMRISATATLSKTKVDQEQEGKDTDIKDNYVYSEEEVNEMSYVQLIKYINKNLSENDRIEYNSLDDDIENYMKVSISNNKDVKPGGTVNINITLNNDEFKKLDVTADGEIGIEDLDKIKKDVLDAFNLKGINVSYIQSPLKDLIDAVRKYDEIKYIYDKIWNANAEDNSAELKKLLGIQLNFEYTSAVNVKFGEESLINGISSTYKSKKISELGSGESIVIRSERPKLTEEVKKAYEEGFNIGWIKNDYGIIKTEYDNNTYKIPIEKTNGIRILAADAIYKADIKIGNSTVVKDNMYNKNRSFLG